MPSPLRLKDSQELNAIGLEFQNSRTNLGLQIADVLTTTLRRALDGSLKAKGWRHLGALMFEAPNFLLLSLDHHQDKQIIDRHVMVARTLHGKLIKKGELGKWVAHQKDMREARSPVGS